MRPLRLTAEDVASQGFRDSRLLVSSVDFGFGAAGKLSSVFEFLPRTELVVVGSRLLRRVQDTETAVAVRQWADDIGEVDLASIDAALVVLDPVLANLLTDAGIPVVYVDSLPHLWCAADEIPFRVFSYCAQRYKYLADDRPDVLRPVERFTWIDPIAPLSETRVDRQPGTAVVNVGGVHAPMSGTAASAYVELVVPAAVTALRSSGYDVVVTGNVDDRTAKRVEADGAQCRTVPHREFIEVLQRSDLLLTSPGMTTMLEAGRAGVDCVLLPPQNLSQMMNTAVLAGPATKHAMPWPSRWFPYDDVDRAREDGEEAALSVIYQAIESISRTPTADGWLVETLTERVRCRTDWLRHAVAEFAGNGAETVAHHVSAALRTRRPSSERTRS